MLDTHRLLADTDWLRALARSLVPRSEADDLAQDTVVAALTRRPPTHAGLRPWLASVARRLSAQVHRQRVRRETREREAARHEALPSTAELLEQAELHRQIADAVLQLDEPYRETVLLRFWQGLSTRHIAADRGIAVETARTRLKRALAMLRARLDRSAAGRSAWMPPLAVLGALERSLTATRSPVAAWMAGIWIMDLKTKLTIATAVGLALLPTWNVWLAPLRERIGRTSCQFGVAAG